MKPDLDVDAEELHGVASAADGTGFRLRAAAASAPSPVAGPQWAATEAATTTADAARQRLRQLGDDLSEVARQIRTTISAYAETDARAAARLRAAR